MLDELIARLAALPEEERKEIEQEAIEQTKNTVFIPSPGPQTEAYFSEADVLLFGGSPGGGKTALEIGLAINEHHRSLIVRKAFSDLEGLIDTAKKIVGDSKGFVGGGRPKYKKPDGGVIHFAGVAEDGGIGGHQGVDHDLICFDEAATFPEAQVRLIMGWLRTDRPGQRCRVIMGSNPHLDSTGDWLIEYFAPWLDDRHPNPAKPGELRYFLPGEDGGDRECEKGEFTYIRDVKVYAESRTFIPSKFTDNPFYNSEDYAKRLAGLPDVVRERLVTGNFMLARDDHLLQVIPTDWVRQAQARWTPEPPKGVPQCAIGLDVAQGGADETVMAIRHDGWYAPLIAVPGKETPSGKETSALVIKHRRGRPIVIVDMGGGYGGATVEHLNANGIEAVPYKGSNSTNARTADGLLKFYNKRAESWWRFREALDPSQPGGSSIMLPPDPALLADLTAPRMKGEINTKGILLESKDEIKKRIGRSTDRGDAVVMANSVGATMATHYQQWKNNNSPPKVVMGYQSRRR